MARSLKKGPFIHHSLEKKVSRKADTEETRKPPHYNKYWAGLRIVHQTSPEGGQHRQVSEAIYY